MKKNKSKLQILISFFFLLQACTQNGASRNSAIIQREDTLTVLKDFYTQYATAFVSDEINQSQIENIKNRFISKALIKNLASKEIDYDPFLNAQDFDISLIRTMGIQRILNNTYKVCFDANKICNEVSIVREDGHLKINKIVNLEVSENAADNSKNTNSVTDTDHIEHINLNNSLLNQTWKQNCNSESYVYFDITGGQFVFEKYSINTILQRINEKEYDVFFSYPIIRPIPNDMMDCKNYSEKIPIGHMTYDINKIEFIWYGFHNMKTAQRVHTNNPFGTNQNDATLLQCANSGQPNNR